MKTYRIGIIGFAHAHVHSAVREFQALGDRVEFVAAADVEPMVETVNKTHGTRSWNIEQVLTRLDLHDKYYGYEWRKLLDEEELDIVLVNCENLFHVDVSVAALEKDLVVVMEKPFATNLADAQKIRRAVERSEGEMILNYPSSWWANVRRAKELVADGAIGRVLKFTYRNIDSEGPFSHGDDVPEDERIFEWWYQRKPGGGAFLDYCCYGANLATWFLDDKAEAAYALRGNFNSHYGEVDDYATITVKYPNAVAILEGTWSSVASGIPHGPIVYGTEGTLVVKPDCVEIHRERYKLEPTEVITDAVMPEGRTNLGEEVLHHLDTGDDIHPTLELYLNMEAMAILDAGLRSCESGCMEPIHNATYNG